MGGGKGGGGGGSNPAADAQARIAEQLFSQTDPIRQSLIGRSTSFLGNGGGMDSVLGTPSYMDFKRTTGDQFSQARESAIARNPAGGALTEALVNLDGQQAGALSQGAGAMYQDEIGRAMTLGTGAASQAMSGFGQAGAIQAQLAAAQAQQNAGKAGALGSGAGAYFGSK